MKDIKRQVAAALADIRTVVFTKRNFEAQKRTAHASARDGAEKADEREKELATTSSDGDR